MYIHGTLLENFPSQGEHFLWLKLFEDKSLYKSERGVDLH